MRIAPLTRRDVQRAVTMVAVAIKAGNRPPNTGSGPRSSVSAAGRRAEAERLAPRRQGRRWIETRLAKAQAFKVPLPWVDPPENRPAFRATGAVMREKYPDTVRVACIPDAHVCPSLPDMERMEWLGRWVRDEAPHAVVQLGDFGTWDSVTAHAKPGTLAFEEIPRVERDFEANFEALRRFDRGAGNWRGRKVVTGGNHENRLWRFEDTHPQIAGSYTTRLVRMFGAAGWSLKPYGAYHHEGAGGAHPGVGFIHHATNVMGRAYGGKTAPQRIANDATFSIVYGHTHVKQAVDAPKLGERSVRVISPGCALPWGHVEPYAKHNLTGWWWGVVMLTIRAGVILDENYVSMLTLERRYAKRARSI